jgi:hypothetical protein
VEKQQYREINSMNYVRCYRLDSGIEMFEIDIMMKKCRDGLSRIPGI